MPLQNRVTAFGEIVADPARGTFMGNRGRLHGADKRLGRSRWRLTAWLTCRLEFRGRHREVMAPGRYTELFFLDEATAFAAGHRPCYECRRQDFHRFQQAWQEAFELEDAPAAGEIDRLLHAERVEPRSRCQRRWLAPLDDLPAGAIAVLEGDAVLVREDALYPWHIAGYGPARARPRQTLVEVLTPPAACRTLRAGYRPALHSTAQR